VVIPGEKASVTRLASSPNETHIAVGYADGNVKIFDITSTENVCTFSGHKSAITALTFDQDGTRLASGSKVCIHILDLEANLNIQYADAYHFYKLVIL
jgi:WD40 repeat protein